ncbi:uncharacterized protein F54H12.2-like [Aphidius gifuensis]|uniref:uncharacterized protein F54H12.2-like n=1 Tax=Aphidius gifuensis TaxID=684658 RepID=UPI001CDBA386|nr:uncharacterized protein F54H12.2-like [Aphidius gifuensis]
MYIQYYENQVGGGALIHQVHLNQRGQGIGGFLGGLCRGILPLIGSALKPVGKELLSVGMNVLGDVITRQSNLRDSLDNHLTQSGNKLKRKAMDKLDTFLSGGGVGYKSKRQKTITKDSPIEFHIPANGEEYIDLAHTMLKIRCKITKEDGTAVAADAVGVTNNFLHTMISQCDVLFNQKSVSGSNSSYPYRAYIETLLNYGSDASNSHLQLGLWFLDTPGFMEAPVGAAAGAQNKGLQDRSLFMTNGNQFEMLGHLHVDVFNQNKFLLNGVEMKITLTRSKNEFCLMDNTEDGNYKVNILEATLIIRRAKLNPSVLVAHSKALAKTTAKYPLTRVEVKSFILAQGILSNTLDNIILGSLPKRIVVGLVDNRAFNVGGKALSPSFSNNIHDAEAYQTLFSGTGIHFADHGMKISRSSFTKGYTLFAFDLTPDLSANDSMYWNLIKNGSLRIEIRFGVALAQTINCIVYAEFDNIIEIDSTRQVLLDYSN